MRDWKPEGSNGGLGPAQAKANLFPKWKVRIQRENKERNTQLYNSISSSDDMSVNIPNPDPHSIYTLVLPGGTPISVRASRAFEPFQPKLLHQTTGCVAYERKIWVNDIGESPDPGYAFMYSKGDGLIFTAEEAAELFITNPAIALGTITMIGYKRRQAFRPHHIMKPPLLLTNVDEKQSIRYFEIVLNGCLAGGFFGWCSFRTHTSEVVKMGALLPSEFVCFLHFITGRIVSYLDFYNE